MLPLGVFGAGLRPHVIWWAQGLANGARFLLDWRNLRCPHWRKHYHFSLRDSHQQTKSKTVFDNYKLALPVLCKTTGLRIMIYLIKWY